MNHVSRWVWVILVVTLLFIAAVSVALGAVSLSLSAVFDALRGAGDPTTVAIVRDLRLPRVILGALIGMGLGASGAALQGSLRNGLAEPYLLGVSGGAAVGAVVIFAIGITNDLMVMLAAFAGSVAAVVVTLAVSRVGARGSRVDLRTLLIAGVIVGAFANATIMVALASAEPNTVRGALFWMMGSAANATWRSVGWLALSIGLVGGALIYWAREIDVLSLGDEAAAALGVEAERSGRRIFFIAALLAAATVAAAGLIGFVGLVVPHIARRLGVRAHRPLVIAAAVIGGSLVVAADLAARTVAAPTELPLGAITALLGVPFFLVQLRRAA
ncbi:MAG TPA: iron ABC transporter permease [Gemmatimonadaceae bacterium]|nr:iron ABC transporter permease [Gemmatimonadaceae bacterium]